MKIKVFLAVVIVVILSALVGYDERHDVVPCEVISYDSETVCIRHPNGEYYTYNGSVGDAKTVFAIFDNKGTMTNPYDDEVVGIK